MFPVWGILIVVFLRVMFSDVLFFLMYIDDMPPAVSNNLLLHVDDSCLIFLQNRDIEKINDKMDNDFSSFVWFL